MKIKIWKLLNKIEVEAVGRANFSFFSHYMQQEKITKEIIFMNNKNDVLCKRRESQAEILYRKLKE